jgi:2,3-bisphosphoglycerate-independent phosphoglycerate mutase
MSRKFIILIGDGMADNPEDFPDGKTPLVVAKKPHLDSVAQSGELGLVRTIAKGQNKGSDVANMAILGYNPEKYYTGRAPIEAAGLGLTLAPDEVAFRCNLVSLVEDKGELIMDDYSAGHITNEEAAELIELCNQRLGNDRIKFYPSVSYRNICIIKDIDPYDVHLPPPHDIMGEMLCHKIPGPVLNPAEKLVMELISESRSLFRSHPVNQKRRLAGKKTADSIWLWGQGKAPEFPTLKQRENISGVVISGVDLIRGLGKLAGLEIIKVPGATGYIDTNYEGKVSAALSALEKGADIVYLHLEAPDEAAHSGDLALKIKAIELFDQRIVGPILAGLNKYEDWIMLVLPDHTTPVKIRTHHDDPVPFVVVKSEQLRVRKKQNRIFSEVDAKKTGVLIEQGWKLLDKYLFGK